jgi:SP family arabinose:H+ symporter-like MFS transporter
MLKEVFSAAGYQVSDILFNIVVTGAVNLVFTFVAIGTVDKLGRRVLMLTGSAGLAIIYTLLGAFFYVHSRGVHMLALREIAISLVAFWFGPPVNPTFLFLSLLNLRNRTRLITPQSVPSFLLKLETT